MPQSPLMLPSLPSTALPLPIVHPDQVEDEAKIIRIDFYKNKLIKLILYYILSILTVGLVPLICFWKPALRVWLKYKEASPKDAQYVLISNIEGIPQQKTVTLKDFYIDDIKQARKTFEFYHYVYFFDEPDGLYKPCQFSLQGMTYNSIHRTIGVGMPSLTTIEQRLTTYGTNSTDIPMKSNWKIFLNEIFSPYYLFQLYTCIFWGFFNDYPIYAGIAVAASLFVFAAHFYKTKSILRRLCEQAHYDTEVRVFRPSEEEEGKNQAQFPQLINSTYLVPGDLIEIPHGKKLPCDIVLLSGTAVMNESMLTGESTLVNKAPLPKTGKKFDFESASRHILFAGTECVETIKTDLEPQVIGVVIRTGFLTTKGSLIRSFLYAKKEKSRLYRDTIKFMGIMLVIGVICFLVELKMLINQKKGDASLVLENLLDLVVTVVPPFLPTYFSLVFLIAVFRLRLGNVLTNSEMRISLAGKVQMVCFDKTGTLTYDSLDLHGVKSVSRTEKGVLKFQPMIKSDIHETLSYSNKKDSNHLLLEVMASCHNLNSTGKKLTGDKLDIKLIEAIGWEIESYNKQEGKYDKVKPPASATNGDDKSNYTPSELSIIKHFPFNIKQQRTTVITKNPNEPYQRMHTKGVPEIVKKLCNPSTIPQDFNDVLHHYTQNGFKVIACASKPLSQYVKGSDNIAREFFEKDMEFLGFLMFENKIRESASPAIAELSEAGIPAVMLTGDSPSAALLTARLCGIVNKSQRVVLATLSSGEDKGPLKRLRWSWMGNQFKEESLKRSRTYHKPEIQETNVILEFEETEPTGSVKDLDGPDMLNFLETLKDNDKAALAMTSDAFKYLGEQLEDEPDLYWSLVKKIRVVARASSEDKGTVIRELQKYGGIIAMVGNGVSSCQALSAASVSIAITDSEATLVSAFMSKVPDLMCVPKIFRQGRTALITSFQILKYMSLYSMIQVFSLVMVTYYSSTFGNARYYYQDLIIIVPTSLTLILTRPTQKLSKKRPLKRLMSAPVIFAVLGQAVIQSITFVCLAQILHEQSWYMPPAAFQGSTNIDIVDNGPNFVPDYDNTAVFLIGNIQLVALVIAFWKGRPFRMPFFRNFFYLTWVTVTAVISILLMLVEMPVLMRRLKMVDFEPESHFRWYLFCISIVNVVLIFIYEKMVLDKLVSLFRRLAGRYRRKAMYLS